MPRVNTALLIIAFVRQSGRSAYCHCRREKVLVQGMTDVEDRSVDTMAHESEGCLDPVSTLRRGPHEMVWDTYRLLDGT